MKVYQISYDPRKQDYYTALYTQIRSYRACRQVLQSSWVIATEQSAVQLRDDLAKTIHGDDSLLVTRLQGEAAWKRLGDELSQWLKIQLGPGIA